MLKKLLVLMLSVLYLALSTGKAYAQNEFSVDAFVTYKVSDSGKTQVTHDIILANNFSTLYATTYTLSLENIAVENVSAIDDKDRQIPFDVQKDGDKTSIKLNFSDAVVGRNAKWHFFISYQNGSFAARTGEVWEVSIPRLSDPNSFQNYTVNLQVPNSFGLEAYISPRPKESSDNNGFKNYTFTKDDLSLTGITAGFGQFQVFSFNLSYHLENPLAIPAETVVALPPDNAFQRMYYSRLDPKPENVSVDPDGNWIATYKLAPRQRVDIMAAGSVQIFASYRKFPKPTSEELSDNLKETAYWQVTDPQIKALAANLKTPKAIYDYVSQNLKYDFTRVTPNVQRYGAKKALENPTQAICMEFTDLFIALARAAGIPAREVNGYAYTENKELQPLSLVADVLHSWPEYYDRQKGVWIPIDPTWGSTTGGVDFFSKLDLRHFAFVIHGKDSIKPYPPGSYKLGSNPQKDVFVSFGKLPDDRTSIPQISGRIASVKITNPGPSALYSLYPTVYFDGKEHSRDFIEVLPPFSNYTFQIKVPFSLLGKDTPDKVKVMVLGSQIEFKTNKTQIVIGSLLAIFALFLGFILWILVKLGKIKINVKKIFAKSS